MAEAYIVAAARTAGGRKGGRLAGWHPADLAASVLNALVDRTGAAPDQIEDVIMGCVMQAGEQSNNIARNAIMASKLPESVPGTSVDRQCGSSQQALHFAAQAVMSGTMDIVIAAGVEVDDAGADGPCVAIAGQERLWHLQEPGHRAKISEHRVQPVHRRGNDGGEVRPVEGRARHLFLREPPARDCRDASGKIQGRDRPAADHPRRRFDRYHSIDEGIRFDATLEGIKGVKLIAENGKLTAASASQICDGASGVMVVNERGLKSLGVKPMARIHHMTMMGGDPVIMLDAPLHATERALKKAGMSIDDIDLFEVNEAFASVPTAWLKTTGADPARLNVNGGAIALGHPLGGSGTKLMTTLINALKQRNKRYGLQTMCEGGGMANVTIVERL